MKIYKMRLNSELNMDKDDIENSKGVIHPLCTRLNKAFIYIEMLRGNWDSYGALAPKDGVIETARDIAYSFPVYMQPEIEPNVDGTISLYWDCVKLSFGIKILEKNEWEWIFEPNSHSPLETVNLVKKMIKHFG